MTDRLSLASTATSGFSPAPACLTRLASVVRLPACTPRGRLLRGLDRDAYTDAAARGLMAAFTISLFHDCTLYLTISLTYSLTLKHADMA
eukprot:GHVU01078678.1.p1 GENE.GHVU01078678.1~~GHVU01078678.1.p1  ORF type:complete len:101 (+),score=3.96 GHVU01078678.1:35-304(+)